MNQNITCLTRQTTIEHHIRCMQQVIKQYQETEPEDMSPEEEQFVVPNQVQLEWLMPTWSINMTS